MNYVCLVALTSVTCDMQVGWFTCDNASNNDVALKELGKLIDPDLTWWDPAEHRIR
jgi:hypothetical protein